eukprot:COSAG01_NODE_21693_length_889_cov_18.524051_1_plen_113_part_00
MGAMQSGEHGHVGASLLWAIHETASEMVVVGAADAAPADSAVHALQCLRHFEQTFKDERTGALLLRALFPPPEEAQCGSSAGRSPERPRRSAHLQHLGAAGALRPLERSVTH